MNYEDAKIAMIREMQERNYGKDTQKKCLITLNQICKQFGKSHDTNLLDLSDVRSFFDFLRNVKKINSSTINNYRSSLKFIYTAILKKEWDNSSFPWYETYLFSVSVISNVAWHNSPRKREIFTILL